MTPENHVSENFDVFIGLDVDKKSYALNVRNHENTSRPKKMPADPEILLNYINRHHPEKRVICAYEAGPTGFGLYDHLSKNNIPCLVVSPLSIPKAKNETSKTNKVDAMKISEYLLYGKLKSIHVPSADYRALRHLVRSRETCAAMRMRTKQRIRGLLLQESLHDLVEDVKCAWTTEYISRLKSINAPEAVQCRLGLLLEDLEYAKRQLRFVYEKLHEFCEAHPGINKHKEFLESIPGIGFIVAVTILAKMGDPFKLKNARQLASFAGMIPWESSTGDDEHKGPITHMGSRILRALLVEAAWAAIRKDTRLRQFYFRIKGRNHPQGAAKKAIVAVARKMTQIIYRVLVEQRMYVPDYTQEKQPYDGCSDQGRERISFETPRRKLRTQVR